MARIVTYLEALSGGSWDGRSSRLLEDGKPENGYWPEIKRLVRIVYKVFSVKKVIFFGPFLVLVLEKMVFSIDDKNN